jgi:CheY-like chemotaxis protein
MISRLLVVDDNPVNRIVIKAMVARMGLQITEAVDGQQGVDAVMAGERFDLVLMDVQMPLLDGYDATRMIRQWEHENARLRLPIVALSADMCDADRRRARESGMDDFLAKPLKFEELRALCARWIPAQPPRSG